MVLTIYRSNRAEFLAQLLAQQLRLEPPDPFTTVSVIVNTWPTSRWLSEQLSEPLGGISANLRFPFPGISLRSLVQHLSVAAGTVPAAETADPWRAERLVWPLLRGLPEVADQLVQQGQGSSAEVWAPLLDRCDPAPTLGLRTWQMARAIADAFDDYALYRPAMLRAWEAGRDQDDRGAPLPEPQRWQPQLYRTLRRRLSGLPFGLQVLQTIERLRREPPPVDTLTPLGGRLRLFGLSSMAPVQVQLLEALSQHLPVDLYLLTPCADLWQRCRDRRRDLSDALACDLPLDQDWLLQAPGLEARFGRLGSEFQLLLEACDGVCDGRDGERDLFLLPARAAQLALQATAPPKGRRRRSSGSAPAQAAAPSLLVQLQQQLADPPSWPELQLHERDQSLEFHACPGPLRQVQVVRDRLLQRLAADPSLQPRDILVMTPAVDRFAPLVAAVFGDRDATGVDLPWRLTDRSQQSDSGLARGLLDLLQLASDRLTASGLEAWLQCQPLRQRFGLSGEEASQLTRTLQQAGFRWGLDAKERGGDPVHSLRWAMDRLLLGLVLPDSPGLAPGETAPFVSGAPLDTLGRWLQLLHQLGDGLALLRQPVDAATWAERLRELMDTLFGDGGDCAWERPRIHAAIDDWLDAAGSEPLRLDAAVVAALLDERLAADSGRFGHRSGALTISALEPMRAIPHRVIVLMGLEAADFPRQRQRPSFHLMDQRRRLGDPDPADQDRYALLEALLSARDHLLISWSNRDDRTGSELQPASPVRQWLQWLAGELPDGGLKRLVIQHAANPLDPAEFQPGSQGRPAACSDRRLFQTLRILHDAQPSSSDALVDRAMPADAPTEPEPIAATEAFDDLRLWCREPQRHWLLGLGLRPSEWLQRLDDLDALELDERERAALLRQHLAAAPQPDPATAGDPAELAEQRPTAPSQPESWLHSCLGQGLMPPRTAAELEGRLLHERWSSLQRCLEPLAPLRDLPLRWRGWETTTRWNGSQLVQVQVANPQVPDRLELWLRLLLACAAADSPAERPSSAVLIARDKNQVGTVLTLQAPDREQAIERLEQLSQLRQAWQHRCWPVPPRTGWIYVEAEASRAGQGRTKASQCWEGSPLTRGERDRPEMVLCFGARRPAAALLDGAFAELAASLYRPLLEAQA